MELSIISRVSEIIREKKMDISIPDKKQNKASRDSVEISSDAADINRFIESIKKSGEEERAVKVRQIKEAVKNERYVLSDSTVDQIAEKIATSLI